MDVAVGAIDRRAGEDARRLGGAPFLDADDLEDQRHRALGYSCSMRLSSSSSSRSAESEELRPSILRTACSTVV